MISKVARWFISPQTQAPLVGAFQDGLIGLARLTYHGLKFNKWHAMQMFADIFSDTINSRFTEKEYTNKALVSRILPEINLSGKEPSFYKQQHSTFLKYHPEDINVVIERGQLKSGVLDKSTCGQGVSGSIIHIIANEYGNDVALETVYNLQQIVHKFFLYCGFTVGISDINISESAMEKIKKKVTSMILDSRKVTENLNTGKLIAPLGTTLREFYEGEQLRTLTPGDDFVNPILSDIDFYSNYLAQLIWHASKGKMTNFIAINGAIGNQTIDGHRFPAQAGWGRTLPYFVRYDTEPASNGFVSTSFREGVTNDVYTFMASEARHGLIQNALKTSVAGYQSRISVKNLESILIDNMRKSTKNMNIIQPVYAELGLDLSKIEKVKFPTIMLNNAEFETQYKTKLDVVPKEFQNKAVDKLLSEEFEQLSLDRDRYRNIHMTLENHNPREYVFSNTKLMPVNIYRIIEDVIYNYRDVIEKAESKLLDPIKTIESVRALCSNLGCAFSNEFQKKKARKIPKYIASATTLLQILLRSYLCTSYLYKKKVTNVLLDIIIERVNLIYKQALIDPGSPVGILAAQCISEPMTQYVLDSKHRTGGQGGTRTNAIIRTQEILGARDTKTMKNPHMTIMVKPEYEKDKLKVQEIANHIEMMNFGRLISDTRIFFENYGEPVHPQFKHEAADIKAFEKDNYGIKVPGDLTKWCIRYTMNKEEMILKSMKLETIILAIRREHPELFVMHTPENVSSVYIRCYIRSSMTKQVNEYYSKIVFPLSKEIKNVIIRGAKDILATAVIDITKNVLQPDGSFKLEKIYGIYTTGSNIKDVISNPYIDPYRTQSDSIEEIERVFGIAAARCKIINEMCIALELNRIHCTIFADEMCYSGHVTNIQKTGLQKRENANITLRISFQTAIQVIQDAAVHGLVDHISGISGPMVMGTNPNIGTTYNGMVVNQEFIEQNAKSLESIAEDL